MEYQPAMSPTLRVDGHNRHTDFTHLVLATGATDRVLPFAGWTVPGVFSLGGAQVALKSQGCAIGERVVFLGSGPLLYLVAWQYMNAGAKVEAVLDTAPLRLNSICYGALRCSQV